MDRRHDLRNYKNELGLIVQVISMKFNTILVAGLFLFTSFLSAAGGQEQENNNSIYCESCENTDWYELFNKTYFVFGKLAVSETFTTPMDCKEVYAERTPGKFFTGIIHILISDEVPPVTLVLTLLSICSVYLFGLVEDILMKIGSLRENRSCLLWQRDSERLLS